MAGRVAKITISLPADLLAEIDGLAADDRESRSFVIREAAMQYIVRKRDADAASTRRRGVEAAMESMREISRRPVLDDRPSSELVRELRDNDDFGSPALPGAVAEGGCDE